MGGAQLNLWLGCALAVGGTGLGLAQAEVDRALHVRGYVATADNIADFFTKPMSTAKQFFALRRVIMNER